jgi:hypothetical protein
MSTSAKLKYVVALTIENNKIKSSNVEANGAVQESVASLISGLKKPLYAFVRERLIEPHQPGSAQVRILVHFEEKKYGRSLSFAVL